MLHILIGILSFLSVFFGVNTIINYMAHITTIYLVIQFLLYIIVTVFLGLYTSLAIGTLYRSKKKTVLMVMLSFLSMGILLLPFYQAGWSKKGRIIVIATIILTMGFLSSYWHYTFLNEECFERSIEPDYDQVL